MTDGTTGTPGAEPSSRPMKRYDWASSCQLYGNRRAPESRRGLPARFPCVSCAALPILRTARAGSAVQAGPLDGLWPPRDPPLHVVISCLPIGSLHLDELLRTCGADRAGGRGSVGLDVAARRAQEESRAVRVSFLRHGCQRHGAEPRPKRFIVNCEGRASRIRATFHGNAPFGFRTHLNRPPALLNSPTRHGLKLCVTSGHYFSRATCIVRSDVPSFSAKQEEPRIVSARQRLDSSRRSAIVEYRDAAERQLGVVRILCHVPRDGHGKMRVKYDRSAAESKKAGGSKGALHWVAIPA